MRSRDFKYDVQKQQEANNPVDLQYSVQAIQINDEEGSIELELNIGCHGSRYLAKNLIATMFFYQNGITRFVIGEPGNERFRITQEDISVEWDNLEPMNLAEKVETEENYIQIAGLTREESGNMVEDFMYTIELNPFKIIQKSNGILT